MEIAIRAAQLILSLTILVLFHEMGHYLMARLFKTRVEKFYLFFDPWFSLFKFKRGDTEYGIGWVPLGGYVKISGMIDESMDKEQMKQPPQPWEFRTKPAWQRLLIIVAGVVVNIVLAYFIYIMVLFSWGEEYLPAANAKYGIACDSVAQATGFRNGDMVVSLDKKHVENFMEIMPAILLHDIKTVQVKRGDSLIDIKLNKEVIKSIIKNPTFITPGFPFIVDDFTPTSPAKVAGLKKGDQLVGIDSTKLSLFAEFPKELAKHKNDTVVVHILRNGSPMEIRSYVDPNGKLGIAPVQDIDRFFKTKKIEYSFFAAIPAGIKKANKTIVDYLRQFKLLFAPSTGAYKSLGGFITIGKIFPAEWDWQAFWSLTAFLSLILGVINIFPIPMLDGGHALFILFEMVTGKKPSDKFMEYAQIVGMVLLFGLLIFANGNDIFKLFK